MIVLAPTVRSDVYRVCNAEGLTQQQIGRLVRQHVDQEFPCPMKTYKACSYVVRVRRGRRTKAVYAQVLLT